MNPIDNVLSLLPGYKRSGKDWSARCPAHEDRLASLSIGVNDDGSVLLHCHKGCSVDDICGALHISVSDLFSHNGNGLHRPTKTDKPGFDTARGAVADIETWNGKVSAFWVYTTADGKPVCVMCRFDRGAGKKEFRPVSLRGGKWRAEGMAEPRVLYRLHEVVKSDVVYVTEGEKAADAVASIGLCSTTSAHGSQSPEKTDWSVLNGKRVVIFPDNDDAGRKYADSVLGLLAKNAPKANACIVALPGLPEKGDFVEWLQANKDLTPEKARLRIEEIVSSQTQIGKPKTLRDAVNVVFTKLDKGSISDNLITLGIAELDEALGGGVDAGELVLFAARPSHGKSALAFQCVHHWTELGINSLIISEEMPAEAIAKRTLQFASEVPVERWHIHKAQLRNEAEKHLAARAECFIVENVRTADAAAKAIGDFVMDHGVKCVVVDYAQLLRSKGKSRQEEITNTSIAIRQATSAHNVVCVLLCQLNREIEKRDKFVPQLTDLKDSGQLEQDADVVVMTVWPHQLNNSIDPKTYQLFVRKNRNRGICKAALQCDFEPSRQRFISITPNVEEMENYTPAFGEWNRQPGDEPDYGSNGGYDF